mgnify:CR=1 FL=1
MDRKIIMWAVIAVLVAAVIFLTLKAPATGQVVSSAGQVVGQVPSSGGMVGGC